MPASKLLMDVGNRLLQRREEIGLTQKQAARMMGISETHYGEIERGNKRLTVERLIQIHEIMDVDLTWLISGDLITPHFSAELMEKCNPEKEELLNSVLKELRRLCKNR